LLHPPLLDEIGLQAAVPWYLSSFSERSGIRVDLEMPPDIAKLPDQIELTVFRILQECLTNVHRHSGSKVAKVKITPGDGNITLEVRDEGHGLTPRNGSGEVAGVGITGMRERVHELGGGFEITSSPAGTLVKAVLPLSERVDSQVSKLQTGVA
jgi:two-component system, NarL family, sensor kinase